MKKLAVYIAALGLSFSLNLAAQNGSTNQNSTNSNSSTNTVTPGGGIMDQQDPNVAQRDKTLVNEAPAQISTRFNQDFPGSNNVVWNTEGKNYRATYTDRITNQQN